MAELKEATELALKEMKEDKDEGREQEHKLKLDQVEETNRI